MSVSTLEQVQSGYYTLFQILYPIIHNHLASYIIFLLIVLSATYGSWKGLSSRKRAAMPRILFGILFLFLLTYIVWFIVFHFYTFQSV